MKAQSYFQAYEGYFWQWEEEGKVISIPNSNTIAYKEFLVEVMDKMVDQGLPPFGSLLLTIIATNPNSDDSLNAVRILVSNLLKGANSSEEPLNSAIDFLNLLSKLPQKYKQGKNRLLVLQTLFSQSHHFFSPVTAKDFLTAFRVGGGSDERFESEKFFKTSVYNVDFRVIALLGRRFPTETSILEKLADLPFVEEPLQLEATPEVEPLKKDLIESLLDNEKTFHVGSLIKRLWSGLNIPFHNLLPSQQPMGGVSDLTNKGQYDRLLISEFANDDLVFLSRLANNEALYINREVPPQNNDLERMILIDVSIKNWGTPKAIAHAILLAIAKHPKTDIHCTAFAVGNSIHPLKFETVDDIIDNLQILEPCLHPAYGLEAFFKEYGREKKMEVFFISSKETFQQSSLHRVISDYYSSFTYWIQIDHNGNIDLYKRQQGSKKHVQHISLPLADLWKKEEKRVKKARSEGDKKEYPILFPAPMYNRKCLPHNGDIFLITLENRLFRAFDTRDSSMKGWQLLLEKLTPFDEAEIGEDENGKILLLTFQVSSRHLIIYDIYSGSKKEIIFAEWMRSEYNGFIFHKGKFIFSYLGFSSKYWTFEVAEKIVVNSYQDIPKEITGRYIERSKEIRGVNIYKPRTIFKNVTTVFINQANNLVFNIHELRLTDHKIIKLEKSLFLRKEILAEPFGDQEFLFADGSKIEVNRSGMLILNSSDPGIPTIYVPSVLEGQLGVAAGKDFAGNPYYRKQIANPGVTEIEVGMPGETVLYRATHGNESLSTTKFWQEYMMPFIDRIKLHGT